MVASQRGQLARAVLKSPLNVCPQYRHLRSLIVHLLLVDRPTEAAASAPTSSAYIEPLKIDNVLRENEKNWAINRKPLKLCELGEINGLRFPTPKCEKLKY